MKKYFTLILALTTLLQVGLGKERTLVSPNGQLIMKIEIAQKITFSILSKKGDTLIAPSAISMQLENGMLFGENARVKKSRKHSYDKIQTPVVSRKYKEIRNHYNQIKFFFRGDYNLTFRMFNDGAAYRWESNLKGDISVKSEQAQFLFSQNDKVWFPEIKSFYGHQEQAYKILKLSNINTKRFAYKGVLVSLKGNYKILLTEADLEDYPGIYYAGVGKGKYGFSGIFPGYPLKTQQHGDRDVKVTRTADFIAKTKGTRTFPWRVMVITDSDAKLIASALIWKLSPKLQINNVSWIKPGKVAWDWWNALNIYGVNFHSGINTPTYKYFIDFAHDYKIPYIILDEGWYKMNNLLNVNKEVNMKELLTYAAKKKVGIILWVTWKALDDNMDEALKTFEKWGVKGIKVDFMQRDDQWMVDYYWRVAKKAAQHHLLVDYHGAYQPTGLRRAFPNVITREGVAGLEHDKWDKKANPRHDVTLPFTRMVCGPMDYTPGAMLNANRKDFRNIVDEPMSMGTRCHQLAMYVVFESPLQMLADNPSNYRKEKDAMDFLSQVPTVWDTTVILHAKVGAYVLLARKSGNKWYLGAMTNWTKRDLTVPFSFLDNKGYILDSWQDGMNADRHAADYKRSQLRVRNNSTIKIHLAPGGGWVGVLRMINVE